MKVSGFLLCATLNKYQLLDFDYVLLSYISASDSSSHIQ